MTLAAWLLKMAVVIAEGWYAETTCLLGVCMWFAPHLLLQILADVQNCIHIPASIGQAASSTVNCILAQLRPDKLTALPTVIAGEINTSGSMHQESGSTTYVHGCLPGRSATYLEGGGREGSSMCYGAHQTDTSTHLAFNSLSLSLHFPPRSLDLCLHQTLSCVARTFGS